jgi:hypothetical protein
MINTQLNVYKLIINAYTKHNYLFGVAEDRGGGQTTAITCKEIPALLGYVVHGCTDTDQLLID